MSSCFSSRILEAYDSPSFMGLKEVFILEAKSKLMLNSKKEKWVWTPREVVDL